MHFVLKVWQDLSYSLICDLCILKLNLTSQFFGFLFFALLSVKNLRISREPLNCLFFNRCFFVGRFLTFSVRSVSKGFKFVFF